MLVKQKYCSRVDHRLLGIIESPGYAGDSSPPSGLKDEERIVCGLYEADEWRGDTTRCHYSGDYAAKWSTEIIEDRQTSNLYD